MNIILNDPDKIEVFLKWAKDQIRLKQSRGLFNLPRELHNKIADYLAQKDASAFGIATAKRNEQGRPIRGVDFGAQFWQGRHSSKAKIQNAILNFTRKYRADIACVAYNPPPRNSKIKYAEWDILIHEEHMAKKLKSQLVKEMNDLDIAGIKITKSVKRSPYLTIKVAEWNRVSGLDPAHDPQWRSDAENIGWDTIIFR